ncbi:MAG: N-acetylglucosamine-6-phosphate deacetylase [Acidimicrobiales bacterium]|nr:N-acetylglucosamine-6-phosphate deacetylase [Acidimicrobiales bacterium]
MPVLSARQVILPDRVLADGAVEVDDSGTVVAVRVASGPVEHHTLVPGLVDLQVNGHDDVDVATADGVDWDRMDALLLAQGVTAWCPTLVTAPLGAYAAPLARIAAADRRPGPRPSMLGVHLEGPFLGTRPGAHPTALIRAVDPAWLEALPDTVAIITAAAECDGVEQVWAWAGARGLVGSVGHSGASAERARTCFDEGARMVTHLFNAMSGLDHRSPGVAAAALLDDRMTAGLIADGVHVDPDLVRLAFRVKGPGRIALVTDAVGWRAGTIGPVRVTHDGTAPRLADGTLAGSALTLDRAVANVVAWGASTLVGAVRAAATTPADLMGRSDLGRISPGARGDLAALDAEGRCVATWLGGTRVV